MAFGSVVASSSSWRAANFLNVDQCSTFMLQVSQESRQFKLTSSEEISFIIWILGIIAELGEFGYSLDKVQISVHWESVREE